MGIYEEWSMDCTLCGAEQSSEMSIGSAVGKWRRFGGTCEDDGHGAVCWECNSKEDDSE